MLGGVLGVQACARGRSRDAVLGDADAHVFCPGFEQQHPGRGDLHRQTLIQQVPQHHVQNVITLVKGADLIPTPHPR